MTKKDKIEHIFERYGEILTIVEEADYINDLEVMPEYMAEQQTINTMSNIFYSLNQKQFYFPDEVLLELVNIIEFGFHYFTNFKITKSEISFGNQFYNFNFSFKNNVIEWVIQTPAYESKVKIELNLNSELPTAVYNRILETKNEFTKFLNEYCKKRNLTDYHLSKELKEGILSCGGLIDSEGFFLEFLVSNNYTVSEYDYKKVKTEENFDVRYYQGREYSLISGNGPYLYYACKSEDTTKDYPTYSLKLVLNPFQLVLDDDEKNYCNLCEEYCEEPTTVEESGSYTEITKKEYEALICYKYEVPEELLSEVLSNHAQDRINYRFKM